MRVVHFERLPVLGAYSIERLFREIRRALPDDFEVDVVQCPKPGQTRWWLLSGIFRAWKSRRGVNHIIGDVHYVALGLPRERTVLTVHDVNRLEDLTGVRKRLYRLLYFTLPLRRCRIVTAISGYTRDRLVELFPWVEEKVRVIPDCVPAGFASRRKQFNRRCPRILQVGTRPNKNLERLVEALAGLTCQLHIIGRLSKYQLALLSRYKVTFDNDVDLSDEKLVRAYEDADIVAFVSLAEGFGMPIIEAQAVGRPVITSNLSPMTEVAGKAALFANPLDVQSIRSAIVTLLDDAELRLSLVADGYRNVRRFEASKIGLQYAELYRSVLRA